MIILRKISPSRWKRLKSFKLIKSPVEKLQTKVDFCFDFREAWNLDLNAVVVRCEVVLREAVYFLTYKRGSSTTLPYYMDVRTEYPDASYDFIWRNGIRNKLAQEIERCKSAERMLAAIGFDGPKRKLKELRKALKYARRKTKPIKYKKARKWFSQEANPNNSSINVEGD